MNENLNLVEILKDCPEGTKLYSTVFGEVEFYRVDKGHEYPIIFKKSNGYTNSVTEYGRYIIEFDGECTLFPSREQRDWSKFKPKKEELVPPCEFKDGDILSYKNKCLKNRTIYIYRYHKKNNTAFYVALSGNENETFNIDNEGKWALNGYDETVCFATEEEKQKLFQAIKLNGYKWNAETKTLEKLVEPKFKVGDKIVDTHGKYMGAPVTQGVISKITDDKYIFSDGSYTRIDTQDGWELVPGKKQKFDPNTLQPFDKVLVKSGKNPCRWNCALFSHIDYRYGEYLCCGLDYEYCIPYNDDTKHLVGTTEEAPEFYRYWEN